MDLFTTTLPIGALGCIRPDTVSPGSSLPLEQFYSIRAKELARLAIEVDEHMGRPRPDDDKIVTKIKGMKRLLAPLSLREMRAVIEQSAHFLEHSHCKIICLDSEVWQQKRALSRTLPLQNHLPRQRSVACQTLQGGRQLLSRRRRHEASRITLCYQPFRGER